MEFKKTINVPCLVGDTLYRVDPFTKEISKWVVIRLTVTGDENSLGVGMRNLDTGLHKTFPARDLWRWFFDNIEACQERIEYIHKCN